MSGATYDRHMNVMYLAVENAIRDGMFGDDFIATEKGVEVPTTTPLRWW